MHPKGPATGQLQQYFFVIFPSLREISQSVPKFHFFFLSLDGSQASPVRPSGKSSIEVKMRITFED